MKTEVESITGIPKTTVQFHGILVSRLGLRNVYSVWVPQKLSESNKAPRVWACTELRKLFMIKEMDYMASYYLVEDESLFLWDLQEKIRVWI